MDVNWAPNRTLLHRPAGSGGGAGPEGLTRPSPSWGIFVTRTGNNAAVMRVWLPNRRTRWVPAVTLRRFRRAGGSSGGVGPASGSTAAYSVHPNAPRPRRLDEVPARPLTTCSYWDRRTGGSRQGNATQSTRVNTEKFGDPVLTTHRPRICKELVWVPRPASSEGLSTKGYERPGAAASGYALPNPPTPLTLR